jgi:glucuronoarabinoxylan endo-1,4-beta-xylanase
MKKNFYSFSVLLSAFFLLQIPILAQKTATIKINSAVTYQKITGFGGFVCSPSFAYNWMSTDNIRKLWGKNSDAGFNIMRLYIPTASATGNRESAWSQSVATAQLAKSLGIKVFASPWSMPAEWKSNNNIAAKDNNGIIGYLNEANYGDYANYLNDYVTYMRNNGVELDAISIQNEPDEQATYAGCIWTPLQIANFVKNYGSLINCKIMAPESVGISNNYADAFTDNSVSSKFDIYAGHQYGGIQNNYANVQAKGHEVWMTEYLINWNQDENTTRDFNWTKDAFNFANKVNISMLGNINAWVHYASKRYYGLMGDGTNGSTDGVMTKRGYILSHYAKFTTGTTRIQNSWSDDSGVLSGSSYLSVSGDSVIVMVINSSTNSYLLTVDLPFYTKSGNSIVTSETVSMSNSSLSLSTETVRPKVTINPSSFTTLVFAKSSIRPASQMTGVPFHYNKIENQTVTNTSFGTNYQLSGKTVTFDHSNSLFSPNTTNSNGFLQLDDRYNQLVFHIDNITSPASYTASSTTLYYINSSGAVSSHNYGTVSFNQSGNYDWMLDISRMVLTDGCTGVIGISNGNYNSILSIKFGDVYFSIGTEKTYKFSGIYSNGDSNLLDCLESSSFTSLDFTGTSGITSGQDWYTSAASKNCIYYVDSNVANNNINIITGNACSQLTLNDGGGNFFAPNNFTATAASYTRTFDGYGILTLPFAADIPSGAKAYTMLVSNVDIACTQINKIPANTPVLIVGTGTFRFDGSGSVSTPRALKVNDMNGVYISVKAPVGGYYLKTVGGVSAFYPVNSGSEPTIIPFSAYLTPSNTISVSSLPFRFITTDIDQIKLDMKFDTNNIELYDIWGRRVYQPKKGIVYIKAGRKIIFM